MLLPRFTLHQPAEIDEAVALLATHGEDGTMYAGGTELLLAMKRRLIRYGHVIDLKRIPGLDAIALSGDHLVIGALATHRVLEKHPLVLRHLPAYAAMTALIANVRVRAAGTLGGNLCFAEPHADPPALLAALGAWLTLVSPSGQRDCPIDDFVTGPFETARESGEVLTAVTVPLVPTRRLAYERFGHLERPTIGVAAVLDVTPDGARVAAARVRIGSVAGRPVAAMAVEQALAGAPLAAAGGVARRAARIDAATIPVDDDLHGAADYKRHLIEIFVERAVRKAVGS